MVLKCLVRGLLLSYLLFLSSGTVLASTVYEITESELIQLEQNFNQQEMKYSQVLILLNESGNIIQKQEVEIKMLYSSLLKAENSIVTTNLLLNKYEKEVKQEIRILKRQRNIAYIFLGSTLIYIAIK